MVCIIEDEIEENFHLEQQIEGNSEQRSKIEVELHSKLKKTQFPIEHQSDV